MSGVQVAPPGPFNFRSPDEWPRWRRRYEQFQVASGLAAEVAVKQVTTFLYCLGEEAESVLAAMKTSKDDRKDYATIADKFDAFFNVRRNIIFERARFNRRNQQPGESAEQYIMALYTLAANCNYAALEDEMIRDRLVVSEKLQMDAELTLEKAKKCIRQREAVKEQQSILKGPEGATVNAMKRGRGRRGQRERRDRDSQPRSSRLPTDASGGREMDKRSTKQCTRCGKEQHTRNKCPARDATCHKCGKKGHYRAHSADPRRSTSRTSRPRSSTPLRHPRRRMPGTQIFWWEV